MRAKRIASWGAAISLALGAGGCSSRSSGASAGGTDASADGSPADLDAAAETQADGGDAGSSTSPDGSMSPYEAGTDGGAVSVSITFDARVGSAEFTCAPGTTYTNLGTVPSTAVISDFRFYVYDVSLVDAGGSTTPVVLKQDGVWQYENVALLDFENGTGNCSGGTPATNATVSGTVAPGNYTGVAFKLGVPFSLDHGDPATAPSPLNVDGMTWGWQYGYKYWRNDSSLATVPAPDAGPDASAPVNPFFVHLGATGCVGDPLDGGVVSSCSNPNVTTVTLTGFDPTRNKIVADFASVVAFANLDRAGVFSCMSDPSDPDCTTVFQAFGLALSTGMPAVPPSQTVFRVE